MFQQSIRQGNALPDPYTSHANSPPGVRCDDAQSCGARNCDAATSRAHLGDTLAELDGGGHLRSLDGACGAHSTEKRAVPSSTTDISRA